MEKKAFKIKKRKKHNLSEFELYKNNLKSIINL